MSSEWASGKLGDFLELKRGYDLPQAKREPGDVPLVSSSTAKDALFDRLSKLVPSLEGTKGAGQLTKPGLRVDFYSPNPSNVARETLQAMTPSATGVCTGSVWSIFS